MAYWAVAAAFSVASGFESARQYRLAGKEAIRQSIAQAAELERQKADINIIASEQHFDRMNEFKDLVSENEAYIAAMGREDRSVKALQKREQDKYSRDISRLRSQQKRDLDTVDRQIEAELASGRARNRQYRSAARGSLLSTFSNAANLVGVGD